MTAEWKKTALERTKRKNDLAQAQAEVEDLKFRLDKAKHEAQYYASKCEQLLSNLTTTAESHRRYDALRAKGVLIDIDGEFKFLQGKDLDEFWDARDKRAKNRILNESMMAQMLANTISTPFNPVSEGTVTGWVKDGDARWTKFEVVYGSDS